MRLDAELDRWEGESVTHWRSAWGIPELHILEITASTNDDVRSLGEHHAPSGTVVIAERQSAGRGRRGRAWYGTAGRSLHYSMLLRPGSDGFSTLTAAPVRVGLVTARALNRALGLTVALKWPNDLQFSGRKIGGILCESIVDTHPFLVVGIGINVTQQEDDFPPELRDHATSLAAASMRAIRRATVAGALATGLRPAAPLIAQPFSTQELAELDALDALKGRRIEVDGILAGVARGIMADGCLRVDRNGKLVDLHSGTVRVVS
jgi:BirA family transcriptional regulator, biotin operon repressor / biotin---[acetyl-CoA-carboxylase] ligase